MLVLVNSLVLKMFLIKYCNLGVFLDMEGARGYGTGEGGSKNNPNPNVQNKRIQQTQAQVDEVSPALIACVSCYVLKKILNILCFHCCLNTNRMDNVLRYVLTN